VPLGSGGPYLTSTGDQAIAGSLFIIAGNPNAPALIVDAAPSQIADVMQVLDEASGNALTVGAHGQTIMSPAEGGVLIQPVDTAVALTLGNSVDARLRFNGVYAANPSNPPAGQGDIFILDTGAAQELRVRYNDGGIMRTGSIALT
jgi:hypothetical protein